MTDTMQGCGQQSTASSHPSAASMHLHTHPCLCRTTWLVTNASTGGSDVAASAATALAAASLALRVIDPTFASTALERSSQLLDLAMELRTRTNATYCAVAACSGEVAAGSGDASTPWSAYPSTSVDDDLAWGAAWLSRATGSARARPP